MGVPDVAGIVADRRFVADARDDAHLCGLQRAVRRPERPRQGGIDRDGDVQRGHSSTNRVPGRASS